MKRLVLFILAASAAYGQDAYTGASSSAAALGRDALNADFQRTMLVYVYGSSGNLNNLAAPVFNGNETEFGLRYSQNFQNVPWLTVAVQADLSIGMGWQYDLNNKPVPNSGFYSINGLTPRLLFALGLTPYARIEMNTEGFMLFNGFYTYRWSRHYFTLMGEIGLNYLNFGNSEYTLGIGYEYKIMQWTLGTVLGFRFGNDAAESFHIRWEGLVAYNIDGSTLWARLRYEPRKIISQPTRHNVILQAGFNYNFFFVNPR